MYSGFVIRMLHPGHSGPAEDVHEIIKTEVCGTVGVIDFNFYEVT
jgi:hypothetical protein